MKINILTPPWFRELVTGLAVICAFVLALGWFFPSDPMPIMQQVAFDDALHLPQVRDGGNQPSITNGSDQVLDVHVIMAPHQTLWMRPDTEDDRGRTWIYLADLAKYSDNDLKLLRTLARLPFVPGVPIGAPAAGHYDFAARKFYGWQSPHNGPVEDRSHGPDYLASSANDWNKAMNDPGDVLVNLIWIGGATACIRQAYGNVIDLVTDNTPDRVVRLGRQFIDLVFVTVWIFLAGACFRGIHL